MSKQNNQLQHAFLSKLVEERVAATLYLVNGVKLVGVITHQDAFSLLLQRDRQSQLVYKSSISTIMPQAPLDLGG